MRENLGDAVLTEQVVERTREHLGHFLRIGFRRVALVRDVGLVAAREGGDGVPLRETGHAPAPDRRADQVQRPGSWLREELTEEVAIQSTDPEPLGAPRGARHDVDLIGTQDAVVAEVSDRGRAATERQEGCHPRQSGGLPWDVRSPWDPLYPIGFVGIMCLRLTILHENYSQQRFACA